MSLFCVASAARYWESSVLGKELHDTLRSKLCVDIWRNFQGKKKSSEESEAGQKSYNEGGNHPKEGGNTINWIKRNVG